MPIYGYRCDECGHELETFQNMSDAPLTTCSECGGRLRKQLYPVGVVFKGSGFYTTDYRNGSKSDASESSSGDSKPSGTTEPKGDSKASPSSTSSSD